jgi:hypothetical protein
LNYGVTTKTIERHEETMELYSGLVNPVLGGFFGNRAAGKIETLSDGGSFLAST